MEDALVAATIHSVSGDFDDVLTGKFQEFLRRVEIQQLLNVPLKSSIEEHFRIIIENAHDEQLHKLFFAAISCMQLFLQSNFTGPMSEVPSFVDLFPEFCNEEDHESCIKQCSEFIARNTPGLYSLIANPDLLVLPKMVFWEMSDRFCSVVTADWWAIRYLTLLQTLSDEVTTALYDAIASKMASVETKQVTGDDLQLKIMYYLEVTQMYLKFSDTINAAKTMKLAESLSTVETELSGSSGKRTKYQIESRPQLYLSVNYADRAITDGRCVNDATPVDLLPKDVELDDDTRLPNIRFIDEDDDKIPNLNSLEQSVILTKLQLLRKSSAKDLSLKEQSKAYLRALLQHPKCWAVHYQALRMRSKAEIDESRAVDRALRQYEELSVCVTRPSNQVGESACRQYLCYSSGLTPHWVTSQDYGNLLFSLGCTKSALEIFERWHIWEDAITCYNKLQRRNDSANIIKGLLEKEESPKLYCMLGDATDDIRHYEKAWELSGNRSSRAQRALGDHHYYRKALPLAIQHYRLSVACNHLQLPVWQNLAFAALQLEDWKSACAAYKKCTFLEPDSYEFWNNLAKCHTEINQAEKVAQKEKANNVQTGEDSETSKTLDHNSSESTENTLESDSSEEITENKSEKKVHLESAMLCLREAVRCKSDCWRTLENFMTVCVALQHFHEALYTYARLVVIEPKHVNRPVIKTLVYSLPTRGLSGDDVPGETTVGESGDQNQARSDAQHGKKSTDQISNVEQEKKQENVSPHSLQNGNTSQSGETQNPDSQTQNPDSQTQNPDSKTQNPDSQTQNPDAQSPPSSALSPEEVASQKFHSSLVSLLSGLSQRCPRDSDVWYFLGEAVTRHFAPTPETRSIAAAHFRRSLNAATAFKGWEKSVEKTCDALERLLRLVLALEDCCRGGGQGAPDLLALLRSHLMLFRNVMNMARKGDVVTGEVQEELKEPIQKAEQAVSRIQARITEYSVASSD